MEFTAAMGRHGNRWLEIAGVAFAPMALVLMALVLMALFPGSALSSGAAFANGVTAPADPAAAFRMGLRYEHGEGVARDPDRALALYCAADRAGHAGAAFAIGWIHANGRGVARDDDLAAAWFRKAATRGHIQAARVLKVIRGRDSRRRAACFGTAPDALAGRAAAPEAVRSLVHALAPRYRLDPDLVIAVIAVESSFRSDAVSPQNAQGLMQLIPATAARFGVRDSFDPEDNLRGGMAYLRWLLDHFEGNVRLAAAAYNAGENAVLRYGGVPPYAETRAYVKKILSLYPNPHHPT